MRPVDYAGPAAQRGVIVEHTDGDLVITIPPTKGLRFSRDNAPLVYTVAGAYVLLIIAMTVASRLSAGFGDFAIIVCLALLGPFIVPFLLSLRRNRSPVVLQVTAEDLIIRSGPGSGFAQEPVIVSRPRSAITELRYSEPLRSILIRASGHVALLNVLGGEDPALLRSIVQILQAELGLGERTTASEASAQE